MSSPLSVVKARSAASAENNEIDVVILCLVNDVLRRIPDFYLGGDLNPDFTCRVRHPPAKGLEPFNTIIRKQVRRPFP
jgi:hypothetical protein